MTPVRLYRSRTFRFALVYLCLFSIAALALVGFVYWYATDSLSRQIDATIDAEIRGLAEQYHQRGTRGLLRAVERRATFLTKPPRTSNESSTSISLEQ